jgi:hypothetical protein
MYEINSRFAVKVSFTHKGRYIVEDINRHVWSLKSDTAVITQQFYLFTFIAETEGWGNWESYVQEHNIYGTILILS